MGTANEPRGRTDDPGRVGSAAPPQAEGAVALLPPKAPPVRARYGYARREAVAVDPDQAAVVRHIFAWRDGGASLGAIAARLNEAGVPTARGGARWYASTVRAILAGEADYRGGPLLAGVRWPAVLGEATGTVDGPSAPGVAPEDAATADALAVEAPSARRMPAGPDWAVWT